MGALHLDRLTWAAVQKEMDNGRNTVVVTFGATEQHGRPSMMLYLRPKQVVMEGAVEGFVGELSEIESKAMNGIHHLDANGVMGDPRPAKSEAGERYVEQLVEFLSDWVEKQG